MMEQKPRKLSDQVRDALRLKHYSIRTENAYVDCVRRSIQFYHKCHPADIGAAGIESFHTRLAVHKNIAASPRNQNLSAPLEEVATALRLALREILPVASLLLQNLDAQTTELDAVRRRIFGVVLQAIALEDLGGVDLTVVGAGHQIGRGEGIPEDRQTAIPAPEVVEGGRPSSAFRERRQRWFVLAGKGRRLRCWHRGRAEEERR
ncbi:MAG: phage integrase N-terminal SAM-like domain-containing protein [Roseiflexus sp.]|nr:phage integrase N-terminal SAM-like domain-containing protein [Roseiflexus sp.]